MDWINFIKTNENEALRSIYKEYRSICLSWLKKEWNINTDEATEIFQLSVVILYDNVITGKLSQLNSDIKSYLFSIAKNKSRELHRRKLREQGLHEVSLISSYVADSAAEKNLLEENISKANIALVKLGDPCRSLLQLFYYKQMKMDDIMKLMGYKKSRFSKKSKI